MHHCVTHTLDIWQSKGLIFPNIIVFKFNLIIFLICDFNLVFIGAFNKLNFFFIDLHYSYL